MVRVDGRAVTDAALEKLAENDQDLDRDVDGRAWMTSLVRMMSLKDRSARLALCGLVSGYGLVHVKECCSPLPLKYMRDRAALSPSAKRLSNHWLPNIP